MTDYIEELKTWWRENIHLAQDNWNAYVELGELIKRMAEAEAERGVEAVLRPPIPEAPFVVEPTEWNNRKLDPLPYVLSYGLSDEERVSASDPLRLRAVFKPRPGFEQDRSRYGTGFSRIGVR